MDHVIKSAYGPLLNPHNLEVGQVLWCVWLRKAPNFWNGRFPSNLPDGELTVHKVGRKWVQASSKVSGLVLINMRILSVHPEGRGGVDKVGQAFVTKEDGDAERSRRTKWRRLWAILHTGDIPADMDEWQIDAALAALDMNARKQPEGFL